MATATLAMGDPMDRSPKREILFHILLDNDVEGLTLIQAAPIHSCDDLRRARAEVARIGLGHGASAARLPQ
jgi:hypothetical protein